MALKKWTDERTTELENFVGDERPVSQATVAEAAEHMEVSTRSVSSKLRKMGVDVEKANARSHRVFSEEQEATLRAFVEDNAGEYTYADIASIFEDGAFSPKSIQGKILSMELTDCVKEAPKKETPRVYTEEEEALFIQMAKNGEYAEAIAEALGKSTRSIRGKALSLLRLGEIDVIPTNEFSKSTARKDPMADLENVGEMTVAEIAEAIGKTERGVKTMLTRRGLVASDYDGAGRREKASA